MSMRGVFLFAIFAFVAGCQSAKPTKKSIASIPMESVDAETNGKKAGGTHFSLSSSELFLDYQYFDDEARANARFDEAPTRGQQVIEQGNVLGNGSVIEGKFSVIQHDSRYENERFCLHSLRANRYLQVCSESMRAIEEFRAIYEL